MPIVDWQNLVRLLEENEKVGHLFRCARVQGLETVDGLLLLGKEHLYVVDGSHNIRSRCERYATSPTSRRALSRPHRPFTTRRARYYNLIFKNPRCNAQVKILVQIFPKLMGNPS